MDVSHCSDRFPSDIRHRFQARKRRRIEIRRLVLQLRFSFRHLFHHRQDPVPQILCLMEERALPCTEEELLA